LTPSLLSRPHTTPPANRPLGFKASSNTLPLRRCRLPAPVTQCKRQFLTLSVVQVLPLPSPSRRLSAKRRLPATQKTYNTVGSRLLLS
ncbi:MAG: hypothetical protein ACK56F_14675, partial [bacterium]